MQRCLHRSTSHCWLQYLSQSWPQCHVIPSQTCPHGGEGTKTRGQTCSCRCVQRDADVDEETGIQAYTQTYASGPYTTSEMHRHRQIQYVSITQALAPDDFLGVKQAHGLVFQYVMLYYSMLCYTILYYTILYYTILDCIVSCVPLPVRRRARESSQTYCY